MNPFLNPSAFDYIEIDGVRSPGLCEIVGAGSPRNWDERKGYGLSGSVLVFTGNALAKFSVKIRLGYESIYLTSPADQWIEWESFRSLVTKAPSGTKPKALTVSHPFLEELEITSAVVLDRTQFVQVADGIFETEIKMQAYRGVKPQTATPDGAKAEDKLDKYDQEIKDNMNTIDELANG